MQPNDSDNPFSAPAARVSDYQSGEVDGVLLPQPKKLKAECGFAWIGQGWSLFREATGMWIGITILLGVFMVVSSIIPLVNILVVLFTPVFLGGLMLGCHDLNRGEPLKIKHLFSGFKNHLGRLLGAALIYSISIVVVAGIASFAMYNPSSPTGTIIVKILVLMALILPMYMAMWFAPALIVLHDLGTIEALTLSFKGCLRNVLPFLLFSIAASVLFFVAAIPLGLGLLALIPALTASQYYAYREIFLE